MKIAKFFAGIFAAAGAVLLVGSIGLCLFSLNAPVRMTQVPEAAVACSEELMTAIADGDFASASERLYGQPELGADRDPADAMGLMVWDAFEKSLSCEFQGACYADETGIYRNASITALDIPSVTENLQTRAHALLTQKVEAATDMAELYDENNDFREDLVTQVLYGALAQAISQDGKTVTRDVTLKLIHRDGQWWVVPDAALLQAITGGVA